MSDQYNNKPNFPKGKKAEAPPMEKRGAASWNAYLRYHLFYGSDKIERGEYKSMDMLHAAVRKGHPEAIAEYRHIRREINQAYLIPAGFFGIFLGFVLYLIVGAIIVGITGTPISPATYIIFYYIAIAIIYFFKRIVRYDRWVMKEDRLIMKH